MSRRSATIFLPLLTVVTFAVSVLGFNSYLTITVALTFPAAIIFLMSPCFENTQCCTCCCADGAAVTGPVTEGLLEASPVLDIDTQPVFKKERKRLYYLDNLKSILAVIVVLHHVAAAFVGGGSLGLAVGNFISSFQVEIMTTHMRVPEL